MLQFLKHIIQLLVNPSKGWEDISHAGATGAQLCREGFYPLLAVSALSCVCLFYKGGVDVTPVTLLQEAIVNFTVYFATYFIADFVFSVSMGSLSDKEPSVKKNANFVIYSLSLLVIINILVNIVPIDLAVLKFLPIYVGFIIYKGIRYMSIATERIGQFMFMAVFSIIAPPYLLSFLFGLLMPEV